MHGKRCYIESEVPRIMCAEHGKVIAAVPWARHDDAFTGRSRSRGVEGGARGLDPGGGGVLRITWEALAKITARVAAEPRPARDRLEGLRRIGIDEKSWGKGQGKYLVIVTDHDAGRVAWIGEGRCQATVEAFFAALGPERAKLLTHVSADGAEWMTPSSARRPRRRSCAWTRSTSSSGPARSWTSCAAGSPASCAPPGTATRPPPSAAGCGRCARTSGS